MSATAKTPGWTIVRQDDDSDSYRCLHDEQGRYCVDVHGLVTETTEHLDDRARRVVAALNAVAGILTEDLEKVLVFVPYLRLLKLGGLADRQASTMEGAPPDPYVGLAHPSAHEEPQP